MNKMQARAELYVRYNEIRKLDYLTQRYNEYKEVGKPQPMTMQEIHELKEPIRERIRELRNILKEVEK